MLQIFDGPNIRDIDPAEVEALPDELRATLMDTLAACRTAEASEARVAAARLAVRDLMQAYDGSLVAFHAAHKPVSHVEALRQVIARNQGIKPPKASKPTPEQDALDKASVDLAEARADLTRTQADCRTLGARRSEAIMAWLAANDDKVTPLSNARAHIKAQQQQRIEAGGDPASQAQPVIRQNEIDRVLSARGRARVR